MNHDDVLAATLPDDEEKRVALLETVRGRAKGAFQTRDLRSAEKLYAKALDIAKKKIDGKIHETDLHLLYSNRAAVRLVKCDFEGALNDCERSLDLDAAFIKTHFRKGQAKIGLKNFDGARKAITHALSLHPENKELKELLNEVATKEEAHRKNEERRKEQESQRDRDAYRPAKRIEPVEPEKATGNEPAAEGSPSQKDTTPNNMRGYKKTADGKTTSYFHTELTDEAKALIGECKPQRLDDAQANLHATSEKEVVGSAWNQAGTFEERNYTKWFKDKIDAQVTGVFSCGSSSTTEIKYSVSSTAGDAHITIARGKQRYIHDMAVTVKWRFYIRGKPKEDGDSDETDKKKCSGTIKFEADGDGDWDVIVECDSSSPAEGKPLIDAHIKKSAPAKESVQTVILEKLREVEKQFREVTVA